MRILERTVLITGAGRGIGAALALRLAAEKPRGIVVADVDGAAARQTAERVRALRVDAIAVQADVSRVERVTELAAIATREFGPVEIALSNAGIATGRGLHAGDEAWVRSWAVNVMGHINIAQAVLPSMVRAGDGYLLITASAVGLLSLPGDAPYAVTKHAAVGLAEWLATTYRPRGVKVSAICPLGVRTGLFTPALDGGHPAAKAVAGLAPVVDAEAVAESVVQGIALERFLVLPHPEVAGMYARKAADPDAWIEEQGARNGKPKTARRTAGSRT